jgi:hypothetical protein
MQAVNHHWMSSEDILAQRNVNEQVIALLAESDLSPDNFYLTGFESLTFNQNKLFALSVVLSSVITFDRSVLILNTGNASLKVAEICSCFYLNYLLLDHISELEDVLKSDRKISHLLICEGDDRPVSRDQLQQAGKLAGRYKTDLIVECMQLPLTVSQALECGASFMIYVDPNATDTSSMLVCRRSRLVQAEGQCRWMMYDLYQYWQRTLANRNNVIEPMAV